MSQAYLTSRACGAIIDVDAAGSCNSSIFPEMQLLGSSGLAADDRFHSTCQNHYVQLPGVDDYGGQKSYIQDSPAGFPAEDSQQVKENWYSRSCRSDSLKKSCDSSTGPWSGVLLRAIGDNAVAGRGPHYTGG